MGPTNEDIPYRAHVPSEVLPTPPKQSVVDEANFSTIKSVAANLQEAVDNLKSFDAFEAVNSTEAQVKDQIRANQIAYDILEPLLTDLKNTIRKIDSNYKE